MSLSVEGYLESRRVRRAYHSQSIGRVLLPSSMNWLVNYFKCQDSSTFAQAPTWCRHSDSMQPSSCTQDPLELHGTGLGHYHPIDLSWGPWMMWGKWKSFLTPHPGLSSLLWTLTEKNFTNEEKHFVYETITTTTTKKYVQDGMEAQRLEIR